MESFTSADSLFNYLDITSCVLAARCSPQTKRSDSHINLDPLFRTCQNAKEC